MTAPKKRGPKPKPDSRRYIVKVRVNAEEAAKLVQYAYSQNINVSEAIRAGIGKL